MPKPFIGGFPTDGSYQGRDFGLSRLSHLDTNSAQKGVI